MTNKLTEFLEQSHEFQLGELLTEKPHPLTENLSDYCQNDLNKAIKALNDVDIRALENFRRMIPRILPLHDEIQKVVHENRRLFLVGCGATGRLALAIEAWCRRHLNTDHVIGIIAGGDVALIRSIEQVEDFPELGARHLREAGVEKDDLVIGVTEGGETPYVLGAIKEAERLCIRRPFVLYCNPEDVLHQITTRTKEMIEDHRIQSIPIPVGPMAITGSTRMQASTALQLAFGLSCINEDPYTVVDRIINQVKKNHAKKLKTIIEEEARIYAQNEFVTYRTNPSLAMTVLTDTTERAPTFGLPPFEDQLHPGDEHALAYVEVAGTKNGQEAWNQILAREPRTLEWAELDGKGSKNCLDGFNLSEGLNERRKYLNSNQHYLDVRRDGKHFVFELNGKVAKVECSSPEGTLEEMIELKMLMNIISTATMGRLGRFSSNVMTWVRPSNFKLIDRAIRYAQVILRQNGQPHPYKEVAETLFYCTQNLDFNESLVEKIVGQLSEGILQSAS